MSAEFRDPSADMAETDNADRLADHVLAHELIAVPVAVAAHPAVGLEDALAEGQHHAEGVFRDRFPVLARLIADQDARARAGVHIDRVVSGAMGADRQQFRRARQKIRADVVLGRQFVARRADLIAEARLDGGPGLGLIHVGLEKADLDGVRPLQDFLGDGMLPAVEEEQGEAVDRHV